MKDEDIARYLSGEQLYGDDLEREAIESWFEEEREAYANLGARDRVAYSYHYHELNRFHAYRHLGSREFQHALGFGSAYGDEFEPIADRVSRLTVVEPSEVFVRDEVCGIPASFVTPTVDGVLPFDDGAFDLITCLGVLHHIPNVRYVVRELGRVCAPRGMVLLREPIISMGDWRRPRRGLTAHERGIPEPLLDRMIREAELRIVHSAPCMFAPIVRLGSALGRDLFNSKAVTRADAVLSRAFHWNLTYHATSGWQKLRPTVKVYVLQRGGD